MKKTYKEPKLIAAGGLLFALLLTGCQSAAGTTTGTTAGTTENPASAADAPVATAQESESAETEAWVPDFGNAENNPDATEVHIGLTPNVNGLAFIDENGVLTGSEVNILQAIDDYLPQYTFVFDQLDGTTLFAALEAGKVDLISGNWRRSEAREAKYIHTYIGHSWTPYYIMTLGERAELQTLEDFDGLKIGVQDGSLMLDILEQYKKDTGANIELVYVNITDSISEMVAGRVDAAAVPAAAVNSFKSAYPELGIRALDDPLVGSDDVMSDSNAYFYLAPGSEQLRNEVSEAVFALREDGTISRITTYWRGTDDPWVTNIDVDAEAKQIEALGINR